MNRFQKHYENIVCYDLLFKDHFINVMQLPKFDHLTLNTGFGLKGILDRKQLLTALLGLEFISNQRPIITRAHKAIDKFKIRENMPLGCKVTLRKKYLYEFFDCLINGVLPSMDNSSEIYNSKYLKNYLLERNKSQLLLSTVSESNKINFISSDSKNLFTIDTAQKTGKKEERKEQESLLIPNFKWTCDLFNVCPSYFRSKCWLASDSNYFEPLNLGLNNKKFFLPLSKSYIFLNLTNAQNFFLQDHNFRFILKDLKKNNKFVSSSSLLGTSEKRVLNKKNFKLKKQTKSLNYSVAFGLKDFISSTTFGNSCGDLESSHGLDILFVIRLPGLRNQNFKKPHYFLSSFQMPF